MAVQVRLEELKGCKSYFMWLLEQVESLPDDEILQSVGIFSKDDRSTGDFLSSSFYSEISRELCRLMFETDFVCEIEEDKIQAKGALEVRREYADKIGQKNGKTKREIDRIWKSIYGNASIFEVIFHLCRHLDEMVNENEPNSMVGVFFRLLIGHLGVNIYDDEDFDHRENEVKNFWNGQLHRFLERKYSESDDFGGLFPLSEWQNTVMKEPKMTPLWDQLNAWLGNHLDEEAIFRVQKQRK